MIWSDKHRPSSVSQMIGNEDARAAVVSWLAKWTGKSKPVLLVGPPGTGKTTLAFVLADQFGYDMIGLNASDVRNKSKLAEVLEPVLGNTGVMGKPAMIFIDEVDGLHGRSDYGGASTLADILKRANVPVILAANDDSSDKIKSVAKTTTVIRFKRIPSRLLRAYLEDVLRREHAGTAADSPIKRPSYGKLVRIVNSSKGDIRSMMNLVQSYATGFNPPTITSDDAIAAEDAVSAFFEAESAALAADVLRRMSSDPRDKIGVFYSSIVTSSMRLQPEKYAALLQIISEADILYGRIMRTQNWKLLRYLDGLLLRMYDVMIPSGVSAQNNDGIKHSATAGVKYSQYNIPWPLLSRIRFDGAKIRSLASYMCPLLHVSASTFASVYLPYMLYCMKSGSIPIPQSDGATVAASAGGGRGGNSAPAADAQYADILEKEVKRLAV